MRTPYIALLLVLALATAAAAQVPAAPAPQPPPPIPEGSVDDVESVSDYTVVTSERLTYDAQKQFALFEKDVVVSDPSMKMKTDKLTVRFDEKGEVQSILAEGRVILSQADKKAWAGKATYEVPTGKITLEGSPRVMRGRDMLLGDKIIFWRDQNRMECYPRARLIIYPEKGGPRDILSGGR